MLTHAAGPELGAHLGEGELAEVIGGQCRGELLQNPRKDLDRNPEAGEKRQRQEEQVDDGGGGVGAAEVAQGQTESTERQGAGDQDSPPRRSRSGVGMATPPKAAPRAKSPSTRIRLKVRAMKILAVK